jgi:hypothetical protein
MRTIIALLTIGMSQLSFAHETKTIAHPVEGGAMLPVICQSSHAVKLANTTSAVETYHVKFKLCAKDNGCETHTFTKHLFPSQELVFGEVLHRDAIYPFSGQYQTTATTVIEEDTASGTIDFSTVTVHN